MAMQVTRGSTISWVSTALDFVFQDNVVDDSALADWDITAYLWTGKKAFPLEVLLVDPSEKKYRFKMLDTFNLPIGSMNFIIAATHKITHDRVQSTVDTVEITEGPPKV